jgi:copper homeostasis protein
MKLVLDGVKMGAGDLDDFIVPVTDAKKIDAVRQQIS